jgi:hypothetical protein
VTERAQLAVVGVEDPDRARRQVGIGVRERALDDLPAVAVHDRDGRVVDLDERPVEVAAAKPERRHQPLRHSDRQQLERVVLELGAGERTGAAELARELDVRDPRQVLAHLPLRCIPQPPRGDLVTQPRRRESELALDAAVHQRLADAPARVHVDIVAPSRDPRSRQDLRDRAVG